MGTISKLLIVTSILIFIGAIHKPDTKLFVLSFIFLAWGAASIIYKKREYNGKDQGMFLFGSFVLGLGIYDVTLLLTMPKLPSGSELSVDIATAIILFAGSVAFFITGIKKLRSNKNKNAL